MKFHLQRKIEKNGEESYLEITQDGDLKHVIELAMVKAINDKTVRVVDGNSNVKWEVKK